MSAHWLPALGAAVALAGVMPARADVVVFNKPGSVGCQQGCWNSTLDPTNQGYQTFAPFTLGNTATVNSVQWQGPELHVSGYARAHWAGSPWVRTCGVRDDPLATQSARGPAGNVYWFLLRELRAAFLLLRDKNQLCDGH